MNYILFKKRFGMCIAMGETSNPEVLRNWYKEAENNFYCNTEDWERMVMVKLP